MICNVSVERLSRHMAAKHPEINFKPTRGPPPQLTLSTRRRKDRYRKRVAVKRKTGQPLNDVVMSDSSSHSCDSDYNMHLGRGAKHNAKHKEMVYGSSQRHQSPSNDNPSCATAGGINGTAQTTAVFDCETMIDSFNDDPTHGIIDEELQRRNGQRHRTTRIIADSGSDADLCDDNHRYDYAFK
jgi:hypothetical protein